MQLVQRGKKGEGGGGDEVWKNNDPDYIMGGVGGLRGDANGCRRRIQSSLHPSST